MAKIKLSDVTEDPNITKVVKVADAESRKSCESRESCEQMAMNEIIKQIMSEKHLAQVDMQQLLEMRSQSSVSQALRRDMKVPTVLRFLKVLGCKLIVEYGDTRYEVTE
ncbi:hypothetical protein [Allobaculum stercoricanis]|uniref:hypothetical protein n=1 Tax=Allobaculum stercoricanis TaxID=174709 RepID=UPI0023F2F6B7|nr:hypothetical protein [Allobaculum stercoricanis]